LENQELGVTLLSSSEVSDEEKRKHIAKFVQEYLSGKVNFFSEEHHAIFKAWVEVYSQIAKDEVKTRVKKIGDV
jgi:hypothetical protein